MFSFFPATPWTSQVQGFPRPPVSDETISAGKSQGYKLTAVSSDGALRAWRRIRDEVLSAGLWLGTRATMPVAAPLGMPGDVVQIDAKVVRNDAIRRNKISGAKAPPP
jgi:hypothetical protein